MKRVKCPCCGNYTFYGEYYLFDFCDVCCWQYDFIVDSEDEIIGANHISLKDARENYKRYGIFDPKFLGKGSNRLPLPEELPENNGE